MPIIRGSRLHVCYYRLWCAVLGCWLSGSGAGQQAMCPGRGMFHDAVMQHPDQGGNKLQRPNSKFRKPPKKKNSEHFPSNQISEAAVTSESEEKWRTFNCFFCRVGLRTYQHPCTNTVSDTVFFI